MASEAITKNDLKAILNEVLPPTPSEYKKLLWQNPNPTAAFAAQTISLDLSDYDEIELEIAATATSPNTTTQFFKLRVGVGGLLNLAANTIPWRYVTPTSTGVTFGGGYSTQTYGASATADNSAMVPERIYGIKYERVAPPLADMKWKLVGTVTGNSILTLPNAYNELLCYTLDNASGLSGGFTFHFNADILTTTPIVYRNGYNFNGASLTNLQMTNTTAQITYYVRDGADMLGQCSLKVYYR